MMQAKDRAEILIFYYIYLSALFIKRQLTPHMTHAEVETMNN